MQELYGFPGAFLSLQLPDQRQEKGGKGSVSDTWKQIHCDTAAGSQAEQPARREASGAQGKPAEPARTFLSGETQMLNL